MCVCVDQLRNILRLQIKAQWIAIIINLENTIAIRLVIVRVTLPIPRGEVI